MYFQKCNYSFVSGEEDESLKITFITLDDSNSFFIFQQNVFGTSANF